MHKIKFILRSLWKKRFTNSVNLIGIVIGLTVSTLIFVYVKNQYTANQFLPGYSQIYRLETNWGTSASYKQCELFKQQIPEIEAITLYHLSRSWKDLIEYNNKNYKIEVALYADSSFFSVLAFPVLYGNIETALNVKGSCVLTASESIRIFGTSNSVGEQIIFNTSEYGKTDFTVKAVLKDLPANSSMRFNAIFSKSNLMDIEGYAQNADHWGTCNYSAFIKLRKAINAQQITSKMDAVIKEHSPEWVHDKIPTKLNPLLKLHFDYDEGDGVFIHNKKSTVDILGAIGLLILLLAGINYFNLNTAQIERNINEIGIRKTVGASNFNIGIQSMYSTAVLFVFAVVLSLLCLYFVLPLFNEFTDAAISFESLFSGFNLALMLGILAVSCLLFGVFPALFALKQKPLSILVKRGTSNQNNLVKNGLLIFQFFIAIVLIASTLVLTKQNSFLLTSDCGFAKENILYIPMSPEAKNKMEVLEQLYEDDVLVDEVAFSSALFGQIGSNWGRNLYGDGEKKDVGFAVLWVCPDFLKVFGLELTKGELFTDQSSDHRDVIYNECFVKKFQIQHPIGTSLDASANRYKTLGVIKDFNHGSLRDQISPLALVCGKQNTNLLLVKTHQASVMEIKDMLTNMETHWDVVSPNFPFEVHFLDKNFEIVYAREIKMMKVLSAASILAVVIASLGLFCIAFFMINKRINEIGIRKVNGATVKEVMQLLNKEIIKWVCISIGLAIPTAYWILKMWLQNFAYKTTLNWWIFALAGCSALVIALLTVSYQTFRAARRNPIEALRYE